jgi:hypothetical protein
MRNVAGWQALIWLLALVVGHTGILPQAVAAQSATSRTFVVLIDRSGSRTLQQMTDMQALLKAFSEQVTYGDRVSFVEVMQEQSDNVREYRISVPVLKYPDGPISREKRLLANIRRVLNQQARKFSDTTGVSQIKTTDLLSTLYRVSEYLSSGMDGSRTLVILSDMMHSTSSLNFARPGAIPGASWFKSQRDDSQIPQLPKVCVIVAGANNKPNVGSRIRTFWMTYFDSAGARLSSANYRSVMAAPGFTCEVV